MKCLYLTDTHNRSERDNPKDRTDNYSRAILAKQEEVGALLDAEGVEVVLFGGDVFDYYDPATGILNDVAAIWRSWGRRIIAVVGSHDYNGMQVKTLRRTGLGNFVNHGLVEIVSNGSDMFPSSIQIAPYLQVTATPHTVYVHENPENFATPELERMFTIQMIHADFFKTPVVWPHQTIKACHEFIAADLVLTGHIHSGYTPLVVDNERSVSGSTTYYNPGSIARTENGKQRAIKVFVFEVPEADPTGSWSGNMHQLKNVVPHPFKEKVETPEGSPVLDVGRFLKMVGNTEIKRIDLKAHIPIIVEELYGERDQVLINRLVERIETPETQG